MDTPEKRIQFSEEEIEQLLELLAEQKDYKQIIALIAAITGLVAAVGTAIAAIITSIRG